MTDFNDKLPPNVDVIDPLGEIRARAKELWQADGAPADRPWQSYFSQAEGQFCGASGAPGGGPFVKHGETPGTDRHPHLEQVAQREPGTLLSRVAASFTELLELHESDMLCELFLNYPVAIEGSSAQTATLSTEETAALVAEVAGEYEEMFLQTNDTSNPLLVPLEKRIAYWMSRIEQRSRSDEPLTNADRNTMARLEQQLSKNGISLKRS